MAKPGASGEDWTPRNTSNKRTEFQRSGDRAVCAKLMLAGESRYNIMEQINQMRPYNLSYSQVCHDCRAIQGEWVEQYLTDVNTMKAKELARIDKIEQEAWHAWEASKRKLTTTEMEQTENEQLNRSDTTYQKNKKSRVKKTEKERDADKKFMDVVQWCVEQRCKILGINAPQRYDINWRKQAEAAGVSAEIVQKELVDNLFSKLKETDGDS